MFSKNVLPKAPSQHRTQVLGKSGFDLQISIHYGIPYTASILAFDPIQRLLAIGTLDGRIKVVGGDNIEGLLVSSKTSPYKFLEFLHNQGFLIGISNDNSIQVWDLEFRTMVECFPWDSNITAFAVIEGTSLMYLGDENGLLSVLKYSAEEGKLLTLPYHIPLSDIMESARISVPLQQAIVGILPQPSTLGSRVLIAYERGILILWDVSECQIISVRGYEEFQVKGKINADFPEGKDTESGQFDREICSLCWACDSGSVVAVGYLNGDVIFWCMSSDSSIKEQQPLVLSNDIVKLQLSSDDRRLPVIILHWSSNGKASNGKGGQLLVYGGTEIGSEEVLTVLNLDWSAGIESLRCASRADLNLNGSFADMILIPESGPLDNTSTAALFVLTNPGQINIYDGALLSMLKPDEGKPSTQVEKMAAVVPTVDPTITFTKFCFLHLGISSKPFMKMASAKKTGAVPSLSSGTKWPLTGGVPNDLFDKEDVGIERLYIAGYQDGSVRLWDATSPVLAPLASLQAKIPDLDLIGGSAPVSAMDFCSGNLTVAVGNESGLVLLYKFFESAGDLSFHSVTETKHEVQNIQHGGGFWCISVFLIQNSAIRAVQFANSIDRLAVGFDNGQVAVIDTNSSSIVSRREYIQGSKSPIISIIKHTIQRSYAHESSPKYASDEVMLILSKHAHILVIDVETGNMVSLHPLHPKKESTAISMYVIDGCSTFSEIPHNKYERLSTDGSVLIEPEGSNIPFGSKIDKLTHHLSHDTSEVLLCCEDAIRLYPLKSVIQGGSNLDNKLNLNKHCCWITIFKKKDYKVYGLILLYQSGVLEIRSLPDLQVLSEISLMSILRWNMKTNMEKTISAYDNGQISMVNGSEVAFLSLLVCENDFRLPDSLPCLHDKVLAAAADAIISLSPKKKQGPTSGILSGFMKGLKGVKADNISNFSNSISKSSVSQHLEDCFSSVPFSDPSSSARHDQEAIELNIDDLEIDDLTPTLVSSSSARNNKRDEDMERQKLFDGAKEKVKPRMRTTQEIMTQYKFAGDATAAAAHAKDKLMQRQEKLDNISRRTGELQSEAENFADLANELVKTLEGKKWWKF